jgi:hypothetical protein
MTLIIIIGEIAIKKVKHKNILTFEIVFFAQSVYYFI